MELEDVLLRKEELPILYENCFKIPVHPALLKDWERINPDIARDVFSKVKEEWGEDLKKYTETADLDDKTREWYESVFLKEFPPFWIPDVLNTNNGFARSLSISRNGGGTLYFDKEDRCCQEHFIPGLNEKLYIKFSEEKQKEFLGKLDIDDSESGIIFTYASHNIDHYPGALCLRNWAIAYENEVLKSVLN